MQGYDEHAIRICAIIPISIVLFIQKNVHSQFGGVHDRFGCDISRLKMRPPIYSLRVQFWFEYYQVKVDYNIVLYYHINETTNSIYFYTSQSIIERAMKCNNLNPRNAGRIITSIET